MKVVIEKIDEDNILTGTDLSDVEDKGEIAHFIVELERVKQIFMELWEEWTQNHGKTNKT